MGFRLSKFSSLGLKQNVSRKISRKLGVSGKSKWLRQIKRSLGFGRSAFVTQQPSSASTVGYQHQGRTLSQLTGGV